MGRGGEIPKIDSNQPWGFRPSNVANNQPSEDKRKRARKGKKQMKREG